MSDSEYTLTLADVAEMTGRHERTIRRWTLDGRGDRGLLPAVDTLDGLRFRAVDVEAYLRPRSAVERLKATSTKPLENAVARIVADAPRLTGTQRAALAGILGVGAVSVASRAEVA